MKAKKNYYLKYLKDNSLNNKNKSNSQINSNKISPEPKNINKDINKIHFLEKKNNKEIKKNHSLEKNNKKEENYSFDSFVSQIKNYDYTDNTRWDNPARKYALEKDAIKNKITLTELNQIDYKNPLLILNKEYIHKDYNKNLLESELGNIEDSIKIIKSKNIKNNNNLNGNYEDINFFIEKIMEKREQLEIHKKILNYYLQYYCQNNSELMTPSMNKIRSLTKIVDFYYEKIHSKKKKGLIIKKFIIDKTMEIILKKKKLDNLMEIFLFLKNNILNHYKDIKNLKLKKMNFNYIQYYEENNKLLNEIEKLKKELSEKYKYNNEQNECKIKVVEEMQKKVIRKKERFNKIYSYEKNNIFESKKSNIIGLYYLFNIEHNINNNNEITNESSLFVNEMIKIFKLTSKKIILENIQYFKNNENKDSNEIIVFNLNKPKLSEINNVNIEEKNIIPFLIKILVKLKNHLDIFLFYYNLICSEKTDVKYKSFKNEIKSRKNEFYEVLDKHLSKIIILLTNIIIIKKEEESDFSKKTILVLINIICIFEKLLKIKFNVKYNKYINSELKNFIIEQIKLENKNVIKKAIDLLPNDIWNKILLDSSFFQIDEIKKQIPFHLKKFISFFNESEVKASLTSNLITKDNIDNIFNYISNYFYDNKLNEAVNNINFMEILNLYCKEEIIKYKKEIDKENDIIIFNKPLNYNSLYCNNSSCCIIKGIEEQIINLIIFESLIDEIFYKLFDTIDIYIFICFKMFLKDTNYLSRLLKNINLKEIQKDMNNLEYWSDIISYQKKYLELKKFYFKTEQKIYELFGEGKEYTTEEDKQLFIDNLISKTNELPIKIVNEEGKRFSLSKSYNSIKNNINIFLSLKNNNNQNSKENKDINKDKINNEEQQDNNIKDSNINEENEDDIEPLNINQINEMNNSAPSSKDKNEGIKFFNFLFSNNDNQEIPIEEIIKEIKSKLSSIQIKDIFILISILSTLKKILKRLVLFTTKIELELPRYQVLNKLNKYEKLIEQIRNLFHEKISSEILDFSKISYLIINFNWSPNPEQGSSQLFEASKWVDKLKSLFEVIVSEIYNKFNEVFEEKKLIYYFTNLIKYFIECVQDSFAKIKKCNDLGRSIMLKDIKHLKEGFDNILKKYNYSNKIKINQIFDILIQYANAWYYNSEELTNFVFIYNIRYKYFESLMNSSPKINELSSELKNDIINKVKQNYMSQFKQFISRLKNDK